MSQNRLTDNVLGVFLTKNRTQKLPPQIASWVFSDSPTTWKHECKIFVRSQLTAELTGRR
ncbi:MAG: hypothetical protein HC936_12260 [Leptolyngbyaceae cyanobacterium SU_3_3]|nr:hypothetical protein [Leptolyngbyaceae cyanobacterium SU_3_3]